MRNPYEHRTVGNVADEGTRRYNAAIQRIAELEAALGDVERLEAQVTRLQKAVQFAYNEGDEANGHGFDNHHIEDALMLHPGDLDPVKGSSDERDR